MENELSLIMDIDKDSDKIGRIIGVLESRMHELDEKTVKSLFGIFSEHADQDLLWDLLHLLESLEDSFYIKCFVGSVDTLQRNNATEWIETISCRLLNCDNLGDVFRIELMENPLAQKILKEYLYPISLEDRTISHKVRDFLSYLSFSISECHP